MVGTHIVSTISGEDYKRTIKDSFWRNTQYLIILIFFAGFAVFYLGDFIYTFVAEKKIDVIEIVLLALFIYFLVKHLLDPKKEAELNYARLIQITGSGDLTHDITFEEDRIVRVSVRDGKPIYTPYDQIKKLIVYPSYVVITGTAGGVYITRDNIPDLDEMKRFLLEKNPHLKEKHMN